MSTVDDGLGVNGSARVTADQELTVVSRSNSRIFYISKDKKTAFQVHSERVMLAADTFENVLHFEYTGAKQCFIETILFTREDVSLDSSGTALFEMLVNTTYTSGGDVVDPINLNRSNPADRGDITAYSGTTTIVIDNSSMEELVDVGIDSFYVHKFEGALILGKGNTFSVQAKSKNIGDICHCMVFYYEE